MLFEESKTGDDQTFNLIASDEEQDARKNLLLFFKHPTEPIFMEKGEEKAHFNVPDSYIPEEYKNIVERPQPLSGKVLPQGPLLPEEPVIDVPEIPLPDLSFTMKIRKHDQFSYFIPEHREIAAELIHIFMTAASLKDLVSILAYCQPRLNPYLLNYCISVTILHRPDTKGLKIPTYVETFPDKFIDRSVMREARELAAVASPKAVLPTLKIVLPENPKNPERRLNYFREDLGVSSHHWHWHEIYPTDVKNKDSVEERRIVDKDRRGELFYYMHHQVLNRYNAERFCNGLSLTKPYHEFNTPIAEGYFPTLDSSNASRAWAPRFDKVTVYDVDRPKVKLSIREINFWRERILEAVQNLSVKMPDGSEQPLTEETGIDVLGNIVESTCISYNREYYGEYHNKGHVLISYVHDPNADHEQHFSLMGDTATAMRDPVFYRWHTTIDDIFTMYKNKLAPYEPEKLKFSGISVSSISVEGGSDQNVIKTLWQRSTINVKNGLDFQGKRDVEVELTHLQHEDFTYVIEVNNATDKPQVGTFRIFMAPTVDETGQQLSFDDQRKLMIEMDKFTHQISAGPNTIRQSSLKSSVTIPFERIYGDPNKDPTCDPISYCDCGWPHYLLVPKGTKEGFPMVLFVMVTNWEDDKVDSDFKDNSAYCGLKDKKYPDKRAMGFPFDRKPGPEVNSFDKFLQPNMAIRTCTIKFTGKIRDIHDKPEEEGKTDVEEGKTDLEDAMNGKKEDGTKTTN